MHKSVSTSERKMDKELLEALGKYRIEIIVDGLKEDEFYLTDGSLDFLFETIDNIIYNDGGIENDE